MAEGSGLGLAVVRSLVDLMGGSVRFDSQVGRGTVATVEVPITEGNDGLVVTGSTGEASMLSDDEQIEVWQVVRAAVDVPLIAGSGTNDTRHACELTSRASAHGIDAVLVVTPYYNRPPQAGLEAHFRAVAGSTDLPVLLYDIPIRSGREISHEVLVRLAHEVPNIVGLKDAAANATKTARTVADTPADFEVYAGDDNWTLPMMAVGAVGIISVAGHWAAPVMSVGHLLFAAVTTAYIFVGIILEERDLTVVFGEEYRRYRQQVSMLVPWRKSA
jgi:4-hydroxy-tetrahydrodipicolinate synthase